MTIALILDPFGEKRPSGLGRAAFAMTTALIEAAPEHRFIIITKRPPAQPPHFAGTNWELRAAGGGALWLDEAVRLSAKADAHIFFTPVYPLFARPRKSIVFVHDFAYLTFGSGFVQDTILKFVQKRALRRASKVVAVSRATKEEAVHFSGRAPEDATVIYNGVNDFCTSVSGSVREKGNYFLLGGGIKQRKNTLPALEGYAAYVRAGGEAKLYIIGAPEGEYGERVQARMRELGLESRVQFLGFCNDERLAALYRGARAFVFPSAIEGFGMMPFEALSCGAPVVYAATPVLQEVLGEGGVAVDPHDAEQFGRALKSFEKQGIHEKMLAQGRERMSRYSWKKAGKELAQLLQTL